MSFDEQFKEIQKHYPDAPESAVRFIWNRAIDTAAHTAQSFKREGPLAQRCSKAVEQLRVDEYPEPQETTTSNGKSQNDPANSGGGQSSDQNKPQDRGNGPQGSQGKGTQHREGQNRNPQHSRSS